MSNLSLRLISGSIYVGLVVAAILFSPPWLAILMALLCVLALLESIDLIDKSAGGSTKLTALVYAGIIIYLCLFQKTEELKMEYIIAFLAQLLSLYFIYRNFKQGRKPSLMFTTLYIWLPLASLAVWATQHNSIALNYMLFFFVIIWVYDSLAYVVGKAIGKKAIFPKVSPKKTVEGTIGGLVLSLAAAYAMNSYWLHLDMNIISATLIVVVSAILGDFFESYYKRKLGVKDSGNIMPGHGGILDRIDSILFAAIPYILMLSLF